MPNLQNLKPFKPGNPGGPGRPRKRPLTEAYDAWLQAELPASEIARLRSKDIIVPPGTTNADMVALSQGRAAISGNTMAAKEMREATEGKSPQRHELVTPKDREIHLRIEWGAAPIDVPGRVVEQTMTRVLEDIVEADASEDGEEEKEE